ncbi:MAG: AMP-binding protein [Bacteroidota bacterium]
MPILLTQATNHAKRTAIISDGQTYTYQQLLDAAYAVSTALLEGKSDLEEARVAFLVDPGFSYTAIQWGIWQAGGIAVPLCNAHPLPALRYVLEDSQASHLIVSPMHRELLSSLAEELQIKLLISDQLPSSGQGPLPDLPPERRAMILYTSGTTSKPKGVVTTHANIEAQIKSLVKAWSWRKTDHILCVLPLHHVHGIINVMSCALWSGACCEFLPKFDARKVLTIFKQGNVNVFMAVPTIYYKLIQEWDALAGIDQSELYPKLIKFRLMVSGSAALPVQVMKRWRQITSQDLLERYGMTEIGMALSNPYKGERRPGHVGKALPYVRVRLVDDEGKVIKDEQQQGEIQVKGPTVFLEYWNKPEATQESFTEDGWFRTGDIALRNEDSYRILGRKSVDIIKSGGYKVSALEIEEVLRRHPDIKDCAVVGLPDGQWGEIIACSIVPVKKELDPLYLNIWLREYLPGYKIPREYIFQDDLPRNTLGKVTKNELKKLFIALLLCILAIGCQSDPGATQASSAPQTPPTTSNLVEEKPASPPAAVQKPKSPDQPPASNILRGEYVYYADAGIFVDCRDGQKYPVAAEAGNASMEKGYLEARQTDMERIYVEVEGKLEARPAGSKGRVHLIVEKLKGFDRDRTCEQ